MHLAATDCRLAGPAVSASMSRSWVRSLSSSREVCGSGETRRASEIGMSATPFVATTGVAASRPLSDVTTRSDPTATSELSKTKKSMRNPVHSRLKLRTRQLPHHPLSADVRLPDADIEAVINIVPTPPCQADRQWPKVRPSRGVGFAADWVSRNQGGGRNLGSAAVQAP